MEDTDRIALIDLDGTVADYDTSLKEKMRLLQAPNEEPYGDRYTGDFEPEYIYARRKMIQSVPGFWRNLKPIPRGFEVVEEFRKFKFQLHVLTKGPQKNPLAWGEKLEWSQQHLPDATVHVVGQKSIVFGRILFDDFPPYFLGWLKHRPRGLVICLAHPWNANFADGHNPNVFRYDGNNIGALVAAIRRASERASREAL